MKKKLIATAILALAGASAAMADSPAAYPGGNDAMQQFIAANIQYPAPALENGIEGVVAVSFTVNADGSIGAIKIDRMVDPDLEQEAIRIVKKMPAWTPAQGPSGPTSAVVKIQIPFSLPD